jgi:hypothetical protein
VNLDHAICNIYSFASNRDGDYEIYVMGINGGDLLQLANNSAQDRCAV